MTGCAKLLMALYRLKGEVPAMSAVLSAQHGSRDAVVAWLLEPDDPAVRYTALTDLLYRPQDDPDVTDARSSLMRTGPVAELLALQRADGSWGDSRRFYTAKYTGTVWSLLLLAELAADPAHPGVRRAAEFIFAHSQHPESGGFSMESSNKTGTGLASGTIPCLTGNMVYSLIRLGYLEDTRLWQAIDWIVRWQRADDGVDAPPQDPITSRFPMCWGRHSCHMGVAKTLKALAAIPEARRTPAVRLKIDQLTEYFLIHHLHRKSHDLASTAKPGWLKPGFPLMYQTDNLELLGLFAQLRMWDARLQEAMDLLLARRLPDGRWKLENTFNGKMNVLIEQKGEPSKWITLKAMLILERFEKLSQQADREGDIQDHGFTKTRL